MRGGSKAAPCAAKFAKIREIQVVFARFSGKYVLQKYFFGFSPRK